MTMASLALRMQTATFSIRFYALAHPSPLVGAAASLLRSLSYADAELGGYCDIPHRKILSVLTNP